MPFHLAIRLPGLAIRWMRSGQSACATHGALALIGCDGDMWIGDVGQAAWEEVDLELAGGPGGKNWGWRCKEGVHPFNTSGNCPPDLSVLDDPIYEYPHVPDGCAITGGYVYRGSPNSPFFGKYCLR